jgi:hypothetical protein
MLLTARVLPARAQTDQTLNADLALDRTRRDRTPAFATLDNSGTESAIHKTGGLSVLRGFELGLRADVHIRHVDRSGWGAYLNLSGSQAMVNAGMFDGQRVEKNQMSSAQSEGGVGNLEVGALRAFRRGEPLKLVAKAGLVLPTASREAATASFAAIQPRVTDFATATHSLLWTRMSVSPIGRVGDFFYRADVGLDLPVNDDEAHWLARVNLGAGYELGHVDLMAELVSVGEIAKRGRFLPTAALTASYDFGRFAPTLTIGMPLYRQSSLFIDAMMIVMAGVMIPLPSGN